MGSVKDLQVTKKPTPTKMGVGKFLFSDRYSVFDWGEMPDHIDGKGAALCLMGAYCFEHLEKKGIKTHYRGLVAADGKTVKLSELKKPSNIMEVNIVNVYKPKTRVAGNKIIHDYSVYTSTLKNCLIPLEIIYRNGLPQGSSVFKRLEQGKITIQDLGLDHTPKPGEQLAKPIFDVSTKLEGTDRYLTWAEAQKISGLTDNELFEVKAALLVADQTITEVASKAGLKNEDGKIELAFDEKRELMFVDVLGTLDECRFTYEGVHVSKEVARQFYKKTSWYAEVEAAKKEGEAKGIEDWKALVKTPAPKLDPKLKTIISHMYLAAANEMTGQRMFEVPKIKEVIDNYKEYTKE
ncbi:MAG TPA: phosphoribosylaminoimidazolesuccinocarboxamide synthase [Candidatus Acidoferrales bacterium]|nr:phosphoribosylaminoimidazolesuccinocarboxamide synthase [Candidatus Acidoferrales bacterium]